MTKLYAGTSGFSFAAWKGPFYPEDLPASKMLSYYAERLPTVEINNTFYRMPTEKLMAGWAEQTPETFRFSVKAPQRITHIMKLVDVGQPVERLFAVASALGPRLGPVLFQLPPWMKADLDKIRSFLTTVPKGSRIAFEFRHDSWKEPTVRDLLREHGAALCIADTDDDPEPPDLAETAGFGYLRLRRTAYDDEAITSWAQKIDASKWDEAFVYFKHEDGAVGAKLATALLAAAKK